MIGNRHLWLVFAALLVAAFNLRIAVAEIGPVIEQMREDTGMSSSVAGMLGALPYVSMGLSSFSGPSLVRRHGIRLVMAGGLFLLGGGTLLRAVMPTAPLIISATIPIGVGIAVVGIAIPVLIKEWYEEQSGTMTAAYTLSMAAGLTLVGLVIVPLSDLLGGWREAFAVTAAPALAGAVLCLFTKLDRGQSDWPEESQPPRQRQKRWWKPPRMGIRLGIVFGLQSFCFTSMLNWSAAVYLDAGWTPARAAIAVSSLGALGVIASVLVAWIPARSDRRVWLVATLIVSAIGVIGTGLAPGSLGPLWMITYGISGGAILPLLFVLPIGLGVDHVEVGEMTAWMLGIGYSLSALGPVVTGILRDLTGQFEVPMLLLFVLSITAAVVALTIPRARRNKVGSPLWA